MSVVVCYGPPLERVASKHDGVRWCFRCRAQREFLHTYDAPTEPSYWGGIPAIRCATCDTADADLFPGRQREWEG